MHRRHRSSLLLSAGVLAASVVVPACVSTAHARTSLGAAPVSYSFAAVTALAADDVWAVGARQSGSVEKPYVKHYDGTAWTAVPAVAVGSDSSLTTVTGLSSDDVWAAGSFRDGGHTKALIEHWDGISWAQIPAPDTDGNDFLTGIDAVAADDIWTVGYTTRTTDYEESLAEHWDGQSWTIAYTDLHWAMERFQAVCALSTNDVWAVGYGFHDEEASGTLTLTEHWNGTAWKEVKTRSGSKDDGHYLRAVDGLASGDVWALGDRNLVGQVESGLAEHWDGKTWTKFRTPTAPDFGDYLYGVAAIGSDEVWSVGKVSRSGDFAAYAVHWDGTAWRKSKVKTPPGNVSTTLAGVSATAGDDVWAVGYGNQQAQPLRGLIEHWDGNTWTIISP